VAKFQWGCYCSSLKRACKSIIAIAGLWRQRPPVDIAPLIDPPEYRSSVDLGRRKSLLQRLDRPADQYDMRRIFGCRRFRAAEIDDETRQERGGGIFGINMHRLFIDQILDAKDGNFRTMATAEGKGAQQQGAITDIDEADTDIGGKQFARTYRR
jgi:hypothetical protein